MEVFDQTSYAPYNRHKYKLFYSTGKTKIFDCYDELLLEWFRTDSSLLSHVEVMNNL